MTPQEAMLRGLILSHSILALCKDDKEREHQLQIWKNELKKYEVLFPQGENK